jgi:hypothetical protein
LTAEQERMLEENDNKKKAAGVDILEDFDDDFDDDNPWDNGGASGKNKKEEAKAKPAIVENKQIENSKKNGA